MVSHRDNALPEVNKFLDKYGVKGWSVLELGQGTDSQFRTFFENKYSMTYKGIDVLNVSNGSDCYVGYMENLPFPDGRFDFVFACHAFEHTERPAESLREAKRVLKQNGFLFLITPPHGEHHVLQADSDHINVLTEMQLQRLLLYVGFKDFSVYRSALAAKEQDHNIISVARKT